MPNPNPVKRTRSSTAVETLPPGMTRRADGRIMYRWTDRGDRHTAYGRTIDEALAVRYAEPPALRVDERTTLAAYLELWLDGLALRPSTIDGHRYNVERYLVPLFGERVKLVDVERELVRAKLAELRTYTTRGGRPLAPRTVALAYSTLRAALSTAYDDGRIKANPTLRLNPNGATGSAARAKRVGVELVIPTELELRRVIRVTTGHPWHVLLKLSAATGLRQSEALGLGVDDLEDAIATRWLHVHRALRRFDRTIDDTKNSTSSRYVPIPASLVDELRAHLESQATRELLAGERWHNPDGLAFTDDRGGSLKGSTVTHWFGAACERAELGRTFRWHDLRHFYASNLLARDVPIAKVSKLLGHASVVITSTTYHHVIRDAAALDTGELAGGVLEAIG